MSDYGIVPLPVSSILARRRPRAIVGVWAWQTALSFVGSWPAIALVRAAYGHSPSGDAALWDAGSLPFLALVSREVNGIRAAVSTAGVVLALGAVAGLVPLAALMISMASATDDGHGIGGARAIGGAVRLFPPLGSLLVAVTLAQGLVVAAGIFFGELAEVWTHGCLGEARAEQLGIVVGAAIMTSAVALGLMHDLARAAVVRHDLDPVQALVASGQTLRASPLGIPWSWAWRALASAAPVVAVAVLAGRIGGRSGLALVVLALLHQTVILARVAFRASWLALALRTVETTRVRGVDEADEAREPHTQRATSER